MFYKANVSHRGIDGNQMKQQQHQHQCDRHRSGIDGKRLTNSICIILMLSVCAAGAGVAVANPAADGGFPNQANVRKSRGISDSFTDGLKYAGQMFGINTASDVANLVAKAFSNVATTQTNTDFLSAIFQQRQPQQQQQQQHSTESQGQDYEDTGSSAAAATSHEQENQYETNRGHGMREPPTKESAAAVDFSSAKLITGVLRMIGFDARKLGALAINAIVMIAQAIGTTLMGTFKRKNNDAVSTVDGGRLYMQGQSQSQSQSETFNDDPHSGGDEPDEELYDNRPRALRDGSPIDWFLENPTNDMKNLLARATDGQLADELTNIIGEVERHGGEGENSAACLKMLVCKSSPFIWGMQKSLKKRLNTENVEGQRDDDDSDGDDDGEESATLNSSILFRHLPSLAEFRDHGDVCKQRFGKHCKATIS